MAAEKPNPAPKSLPPDLLRDRAEEILQKTHRDLSRMPLEDVSSLVYELQVHQMELELQNEELRHAQAAFGESLDRYTDLYEFAPVGYLTLECEGRITEANLAASTMLGIGRRELVGSMMTDFIARESQDEFFLHRQGLLSSEIKHTCELRLHKQDGTPLVVRMESVASGAPELRPCRTALIDITAKDRAEKALGNLNDTLEQCVEERTTEVNLLVEALSHLGEGVLLTSDGLDWPGPQIVFVNAAMCEITGYSPEDLIGQSPRILQGEDTDRKALEHLRRELSAGRPCRIELLNYRKDGSPYDAEVFVTPLADNKGHRTNFVSIHRDITERKHAVRAVQESEAQLRSILASLPSHIAVVDPEGRIVAVNPAWEKFAADNGGSTKGCSLGANYLEACLSVTGEQAGEAHRIAQRLKSLLDGTASGFTCEYACHSPTEERWFLLQATRLQMGMRGAVVAHTDISDRVRAERLLRANEERYRYFIEQTNDGFYRLDFDPPIPVNQSEDDLIRQMYQNGSIAECNDIYARMYGYENGTIMTGVRLEDLHGGANVPENVEAMRAFIRAGFRHVGVITHEIGCDGRILSVVNNSVGIIDDDRYLSCWGTQNDITEQKRVLDARESLANIVENSLNEIYIFDADSLKFLEVNRGARQNLGYDIGELRRLTPFDLKPTYSRKRFNALLEPLRSGRKTESVFQTFHQRKDGSRYDVEVHVQMTTFAGKPCFVAIILDTTSRRLLEQEVLNAAEEERQRIAHDLHDDLGSLLTGIKLRVEAQRTALAAHDEDAAASSSAIAKLISEAMVKTRGIARGLRPVGTDPEDLMSALQSLSATISSSTDLRCRFSCPDPVVVNDPITANHLFRIAQEATNNAIKHAGGTLVTISLAKQGDIVELRIADDGAGFDYDDLKQRGLGLHIMNYRTHAIRGALRVERRKKGGTKVVCHVPAETETLQ